MATIAQDIQQIRQAVYGEEVREAIADGLEQCNTIATTTSTTSSAAIENMKNALVAENVSSGTLNVFSNGNKITTSYDGGLKVEFLDGSYHITGSILESASFKFYNIYANADSLPDGLFKGRKYVFRIIENNQNATARPNLSLWNKSGSSDYQLAYSINSSSVSNGIDLIVPSSWTGLIARFDFVPGVVYDNWITPVLQRVDTDLIAEAADAIKVLVANNSLQSVENDLLKNQRKTLGFVLSNGIYFAPRGNIMYATGTTTAEHTFYNIYVNTSALPDGMVPGHDYLISCNVKGSTNVLLETYYFDSNGTLHALTSMQTNIVVKLPLEAVGFLIRVYIPNTGITVSGAEVSYGIYDFEKMCSKLNVSVLYSGIDIHSIKATGYYLCVNNIASPPDPFENAPVEPPFFLWHYQTPFAAVQLCIDWNTSTLYMCRLNPNGTSTTWKQLSGGGNEHYNNTYNITCNPQITTDTNNYIAAPGDTRDMTGAIQTMLVNNNVCHLGPGDFYVTGVEVPTYGALIGSGWGTRIILAESVTSGYAIKLTTNSFVKDLLVAGNANSSSISLPAVVGTRHGILFEGSADAESSPVTYYRSNIENCMIRNFTGGGITLRNTGFSWASSLAISDCRIYWCGAGINIAYFSEFSRITNVTAGENYYGCVDNGGNNNFANCDFSGNTVGLLIDNSSGQSRNNSHGSFVGCTFNHSGNNEGKAIRILGATAGEIFTAAQIFFGKIEIENSKGIRFIGANIGRQVPITVRNSVTTAFSDCTFTSASESPVTSSGNAQLVFDGCYDLNGNAFNPV